MIELKNVSKSFDSNQVLKNISATFKPGITNMIIGGSGSGKTTLLKCMIGLHEIDAGEINYDGIFWGKISQVVIDCTVQHIRSPWQATF